MSKYYFLNKDLGNGLLCKKQITCVVQLAVLPFSRRRKNKSTPLTNDA